MRCLTCKFIIKPDLLCWLRGWNVRNSRVSNYGVHNTLPMQVWIMCMLLCEHILFCSFTLTHMSRHTQSTTVIHLTQPWNAIRTKCRDLQSPSRTAYKRRTLTMMEWGSKMGCPVFQLHVLLSVFSCLSFILLVCFISTKPREQQHHGAASALFTSAEGKNIQINKLM